MAIEDQVHEKEFRFSVKSEEKRGPRNRGLAGLSDGRTVFSNGRTKSHPYSRVKNFYPK
jgi:hypothetical protein